MAISFAGHAECSLNIPSDDNLAKVVISSPWYVNWPDLSAAHNPASMSNYVAVGNSTIQKGSYLAWCIDFQDDVDPYPTLYDAAMFSSCDPDLDAKLQALNLGYPTSVYIGPENWNKINYLLNHKNGAYFWDVQIAIWNFVGGPIDPAYLGGTSAGAPPSNLSAINQLISDASANAINWKIKCGDVMAVVVAVPTWTSLVQLTIIEVPVPCVPCISVTKTIACLQPNNTLADFGKIAAGFKGNTLPEFAYGITVTNCGTIPLTNMSVIDNMFGDITTNLFAPGTVFAPGASATYYYSAALDVNTTNTVIAAGQSTQDGQTIQAQDSALAIVDTASLSADLKVSSACDEDGDNSDDHVQISGCASNCLVTYSLTICNTGTATLTGFTLNSTGTTGLSLPSGFELAPGKCQTFTGTVDVKCPGKTVTVTVTGKVKPDDLHCSIYDSTGTDVITASDSGAATVECGLSQGSICGYVFQDCDGNGNLSGGDAGMKSVTVTLKKSNGTVVQTTKTDTNGAYCFYDITPGTYKVVVTTPSGYTQTAGTCKPQWKDRYGRSCWKDNDGYTHWKEDGRDCWNDRSGTKHWKDDYGRDCWKDRYGRNCYQSWNYSSCNAPKGNEETVVVTACGAEANVNFSYKGTQQKVECKISGPSSVRCGDYATYTCTVSNTGNACFTKGCKVNVCGRDYDCPKLSPGECYTFKVNCSFSWYDYGDYYCRATATCYSSSGSSSSYQSSCKTSIRRW